MGKTELSKVANEFGERVLETPMNQISLGMTLDKFAENPTLVGSMLFRHCCSGVRVVAKHTKKDIGAITFEQYGAHINDYPHHYLTVAAAVGITKGEIDTFMQRLRTTLKSYIKKSKSNTKSSSGGS